MKRKGFAAISFLLALLLTACANTQQVQTTAETNEAAAIVAETTAAQETVPTETEESLYYPNGQIKWEKDFVGDGTDYHIYEYYEDGTLASDSGVNTNSLGLEERYTMYYDEHGNRICAKETSGEDLVIIEYWENEYDSQGRLRSEKNLNKEGTILYEAYYIYHPDGSYTVESTEYRGVRIYEYEFAEWDVDTPGVFDHRITRYSPEGYVMEVTDLLSVEPEETAFTASSEPILSSPCTITAVDGGLDHTVILYSDGTAEAFGDNSYGQCDVESWTDIVQISAMKHHTVGLRSDGTVVAAGLNTDGQCDVSGWSGIVEVSAGEHHTVGLRENGTVVAAGKNKNGECDVFGWTDIVSVGAAYTNTIGLRSDGTVMVSGTFKKGVLYWTDIVSISVSDSHFVGLKSDGTVVATGNNSKGQCDLSAWKDIVQVSAGCAYTTGVKTDGTVVFKGINDCGQKNAKQWTDVAFIGTGLEHTIGVLNDGTVVAVGANDKGQCDIG